MFLLGRMTIFIYFLAALALNESKEVTKRKRRGHYGSTYSLGNNHVHIGDSIAAPDSGSLYSYQNGKVLSLPEYSTEALDLRYYQISSNSIEKPVQEIQEYVPPQSVGSAVIPEQPPPATPVNAAASNVPGDGNSVFLGSGALGVLNLGGGAYILGSGALGYSEIRRNPRPNIKASTLPPIQASPNLLPAAVNSPDVPQQRPIFSYSFPPGQNIQLDPNGYEYLSPNQAGFGDPLPPRRLKITNAYAVPTTLVLPPRIKSPAQLQALQPFQPLQQRYQSVPAALTIPQTLPQSIPQTIPQSIPQTIPQSVTQPVTQSITVESDYLNIYPKSVDNLYDYLKK